MKALPHNQAVFELTFATLFWGFGYIATVWALEMASATEITFLRFFLGGLFGLVLVKSFRLSFDLFKHLMRLSFWPGLFMAILLLSQTWGLKYTTAVNSTFITALYVVITPLFEWLFLSRKSHPLFVFYALLSLLGLSFILSGSLQFGLTPLSWVGDLLTLLTAIFSAAHLVYIGQIWDKIHRPFLFNALQSLWAAVLIFPWLVIETLMSSEHSIHLLTMNSDFSMKGAFGLLALIFGSTVLAFFLQLRAQSVLSPSLTSIICLLESPIALIFALLLLSQPQGVWAYIGAGVIFLSAFAATVTESRMKKSELQS